MTEQAAEQKQEQAKFDPATFPLKAIMGRKVGMTQIFSETGQRIPLSAVYTGSCQVTQVKSAESDGYTAVQLGVGEIKEKNLPKSYVQHFKKHNAAVSRWLKEFRVKDPSKFAVGQKVPLDIFIPGDYVDVSGTSKGKGFAGVMKRHNFSGLPTSHGASDKVRSRGSSGGGSGQPQRVFKGTGMAGRMGQDWITTHKIEIVKVDKENEMLLLKGALPGSVGSMVVIKETIKALKHKRALIAQKTSVKKAANVAKKAAPSKAPAAAAKK